MSPIETQTQVAALLRASTDLGVPAAQVESMAVSADCGEAYLALQSFCEQLYEYEVPVPRALFARITELAAQIELDPKFIQRLEPYVR